jgi:hypothetical protein
MLGLVAHSIAILVGFDPINIRDDVIGDRFLAGSFALPDNA